MYVFIRLYLGRVKILGLRLANGKELNKQTKRRRQRHVVLLILLGEVSLIKRKCCHSKYIDNEAL